MQTWDAATLGRFLDAERGTRYHVAFLFLATTGCRRGEAFGLRWTDVDLETGRASPRHTIGAIDHRIYEKSTPTPTGPGDRSRRRHGGRTPLVEDPAGRGTTPARPANDDRGIVPCHPDGRPHHPDRFSREFDRRIARHGVPRIRLHDLRHTWATLALQAGVDVKIVSERLGHASATITWDIYQHVTPAMQSDAAERVASLIFRPQAGS